MWLHENPLFRLGRFRLMAWRVRPNEFVTGVHSIFSDWGAQLTADWRVRYTHHGRLAGEGRRVVAPPCPRYTAAVRSRYDFLTVRFSSSVIFLATIWSLIEISRSLIHLETAKSIAKCCKRYCTPNTFYYYIIAYKPDLLPKSFDHLLLLLWLSWRKIGFLCVQSLASLHTGASNAG